MAELSKKNTKIPFGFGFRKPAAPREDTITAENQISFTDFFNSCYLDELPWFFNALKKEQVTEKPKVGFGLNKMKEEPGASSKSKKNDEPEIPERNQIDVSSTEEELNTMLGKWFAAQITTYQKRRFYSVQAQLLSVKDENDKKTPVLEIPVWLQVSNRNVGFEIRGNYGEYRYSKALSALAEDKEIALPTLPSILEDFNPENFIADLREILIPHKNLSIEQTFMLILTTPPAYVLPKNSGQKAQILPPAGDTMATWQSMLDSGFIPATYNASQLPLADQAYSGSSFHIHGDDDSDDPQILATLITLLAYQGKKIVLLGEGNFAIEQVCTQLEMNHIRECCLPLHKVATRRNLTETLADIIDHSWETQSTKPVDNQKIRKLLSNTTKYELAWKSAFGELGMSPGQLTQTLAERNNTPSIPIPVPEADKITRDDIVKWKRVLISYQKTKQVVGNIEEHPWRNSELTGIADENLGSIEELFDTTNEHLKELNRLLKDICNYTGAEKPQNFAELMPFIQVIRMLLNSPPMDAIQLQQSWNPLPEFLENAIQLIKDGKFKLREMSMYFHTNIIQEDLDELIPELEKSKGSFMRFFNWRYQKTVERLLNYGVNNKLDENDMFWHNLHKAKEIKKIRTRLSKNDTKLKAYLSDDWEGLGTDLDYIDRKIVWFQQYDKRAKQYPWLKSDKTIEFILGIKGKTEARLEQLEPVMTQLQDSLVQIRTKLKLTDKDSLHFYSRHELDSIKDILDERKEQLPYLKSWCAFRRLEESVAEPFIREFLDKAPKRKDIQLKDYPEVLEKLILEHVLQAARAERPVLDLMTPELLEKQLEMLSGYIQRLRFNTAPMLKEHFRESRQKSGKKDQAPAELLRHELQKHARRNSVAKTLEKTFDALMDFTPVWAVRKDQWAEFEHLFSKFDVIVHINGIMPDTIPANAQLIQAKKARKVNNLPSVSHKKPEIFAQLFKKPLPVESHSVLKSSITEGKIAWQILDHALQFISDEEHNPVVSLNGSSGDYSAKFWNQLAEYANSKREIRDIIARPEFIADHIIVSEPKLPVQHPSEITILDACVSGAAKSTGFGLAKSVSLPDVDYEQIYENTATKVHAFSNEKSVLNNIEDTFKAFAQPEAKSGNLFARLVNEKLDKQWQFIPLRQPAVGYITHTQFEELRYVIWSEADEEDISLWNVYDEILGIGAVPLLFSGLHHLSSAKQRVVEIHQKLKDDLEEHQIVKARELEEQKLKELQEIEKSAEDEAPEAQKPEVQETVLYTDSVLDKLINVPAVDTELVFKKAGKQRKAPIVDYNELPALKDYVLHEGLNMGSREDFLDASDKQIQKLLLDIVKTESPIYWRNLMRCFASYWQIQRLSQNVEAILFRGISALLESEKIFAKDGCLYDNPDFNFKVRNRASTIAYHRPDELPLDECEMALFMVLEKYHPLPESKLFDAAAHVLGFNRADRVLEEQFRKALMRMAAQETVQEGSYGLQLKPSLYKSSVKMPGSQ